MVRLYVEGIYKKEKTLLFESLNNGTKRFLKCTRVLFSMFYLARKVSHRFVNWVSVFVVFLNESSAKRFKDGASG